MFRKVTLSEVTLLRKDTRHYWSFMVSTQILVIDDNIRLFDSLRPNFNNFGIDALHATSKREAFALLRTQDIELVLLDIRLGSENGIDILKTIRERNSELPVIVITGFASVDTAVEAMKLGAHDYVTKPLDFERLLKIVENSLELRRLSNENGLLRKQLQRTQPLLAIKNDYVNAIVENARKLAETDMPVLITGENGTGKEVIADYIHRESLRKRHDMLKINCAAFPETLLDNELFGHEKGAYTGADSAFPGIFERADRSTLFLDEIGDMPLTIQAKILRVLQNNEIRRIGSTNTKKIDVRFIAATNQDLSQEIEKKKFREDLFFRLNTAMIHVPPLRDRLEDISALATYFLTEFSQTHGKPNVRISPEVFDLFHSYPWPGNIRELKNTLNYAVALSDGQWIRSGDLPPQLIGNGKDRVSIRGRREQVELNLVAKTLKECKGNKKRAAEILGISRKTLYAKLERYGIHG